jgi:hypothetical protein
MLSLTDNKWKTFEGGYKKNYDASIPLLKLEKESDLNTQSEILDELFNELHHQGDIGIASYLSLPHLIRIGIDRRITNYKIIGLIATIEIARHGANPPIPKEHENSYFDMLKKVTNLVLINFNWDRTYACCALSAIAASKGQIDIAKVILELEDPDLSNKFDQFLENY